MKREVNEKSAGRLSILWNYSRCIDKKTACFYEGSGSNMKQLQIVNCQEQFYAPKE